ncbi:MAG: hypothetical protein N2314_03580 [Brevinematales bacterium]|nr:hypothetical protein [Brevinematales bacterium]
MASAMVFWWEIPSPPSFANVGHTLLQTRIKTPPLRLFVYQKRSSYIRLQLSQEDMLFEAYIPWERWSLLIHKLSAGVSPPFPQKRSDEAFGLFCEECHLPLERFFAAGWVQLYSHGEIPLWIFPAHREETLWEFFLPIATRKTLPDNGKRLIIADTTLAHAREEVDALLSLGSTDVIEGDFLLSVVWQTPYTSLHVISHGKKGSLLINTLTLSSLPVQANDLVFFHCCEILDSSQSLAAHTLSQGTRCVIAPTTPIPDDGALLPSLQAFYQLYALANARYSFHVTSLLFPAFKQTFRLALPYQRLYIP